MTTNLASSEAILYALADWGIGRLGIFTMFSPCWSQLERSTFPETYIRTSINLFLDHYGRERVVVIVSDLPTRTQDRVCGDKRPELLHSSFVLKVFEFRYRNFRTKFRPTLYSRQHMTPKLGIWVFFFWRGSVGFKLFRVFSVPNEYSGHFFFKISPWKLSLI